MPWSLGADGPEGAPAGTWAEGVRQGTSDEVKDGPEAQV